MRIPCVLPKNYCSCLWKYSLMLSLFVLIFELLMTNCENCCSHTSTVCNTLQAVSYSVRDQAPGVASPRVLSVPAGISQESHAGAHVGGNKS